MIRASLKKKVFYIFAIAFVIAMLFPLVFTFIVYRFYRDFLFTHLAEVPEAKTALVLGAGVVSNKYASPVLYERVEAAVELYNYGKVSKLIMSGDNRSVDYNEPQVMINLAMDMGVPAEALQPDYAGRRTYDSCWRAKNIFLQDRIIVVTQDFHAGRSVFTCRRLGIETYAYIADYPPDLIMTDRFRLTLRDNLAMVNSFFDLYFRKPRVVGGDEIEI